MSKGNFTVENLTAADGVTMGADDMAASPFVSVIPEALRSAMNESVADIVRGGRSFDIGSFKVASVDEKSVWSLLDDNARELIRGGQDSKEFQELVETLEDKVAGVAPEELATALAEEINNKAEQVIVADRVIRAEKQVEHFINDTTNASDAYNKEAEATPNLNDDAQAEYNAEKAMDKALDGLSDVKAMADEVRAELNAVKELLASMGDIPPEFSDTVAQMESQISDIDAIRGQIQQAISTGKPIDIASLRQKITGLQRGVHNAADAAQSVTTESGFFKAEVAYDYEKYWKEYEAKNKDLIAMAQATWGDGYEAWSQGQEARQQIVTDAIADMQKTPEGRAHFNEMVDKNIANAGDVVVAAAKENPQATSDAAGVITGMGLDTVIQGVAKVHKDNFVEDILTNPDNAPVKYGMLVDALGSGAVSAEILAELNEKLVAEGKAPIDVSLFENGGEKFLKEWSSISDPMKTLEDARSLVANGVDPSKLTPDQQKALRLFESGQAVIQPVIEQRVKDAGGYEQYLANIMNNPDIRADLIEMAEYLPDLSVEDIPQTKEEVTAFFNRLADRHPEILKMSPEELKIHLAAQAEEAKGKFENAKAAGFEGDINDYLDSHYSVYQQELSKVREEMAAAGMSLPQEKMQEMADERANAIIIENQISISAAKTASEIYSDPKYKDVDPQFLNEIYTETLESKRAELRVEYGVVSAETDQQTQIAAAKAEIPDSYRAAAAAFEADPLNADARTKSLAQLYYTREANADLMFSDVPEESRFNEATNIAAKRQHAAIEQAKSIADEDMVMAAPVQPTMGGQTPAGQAAVTVTSDGLVNTQTAGVGVITPPPANGNIAAPATTSSDLMAAGVDPALAAAAAQAAPAAATAVAAGATPPAEETDVAAAATPAGDPALKNQAQTVN